MKYAALSTVPATWWAPPASLWVHLLLSRWRRRPYFYFLMSVLWRLILKWVRIPVLNVRDVVGKAAGWETEFSLCIYLLFSRGGFKLLWDSAPQRSHKKMVAQGIRHQPRVQVPALNFLSVWHIWLSLGFLICKMGMMITAPASQWRWTKKKKHSECVQY